MCRFFRKNGSSLTAKTSGLFCNRDDQIKIHFRESIRNRHTAIVAIKKLAYTLLVFGLRMTSLRCNLR